MGSVNLPFHIDHGLKHLITGGDDLGVRLEAALGDDHVGEFVGDIDIGDFIRSQNSLGVIAGTGLEVKCFIFLVKT